MKIGFIGLGIMGAPMAGHLLAAGHTLYVHSRTRSKAEELEKRGAIWADSPRACAAAADVLCLNLPDAPDIETVLFGGQGAGGASPPAAVEGLQVGAIVIDFSTISPDAARGFAARLRENGVAFLDAPVTGGEIGAKRATLTIMVGGEAAALDRVRPLLEKLGQKIRHVGPSGSGQALKAVNQVMCAVNMIGVCEGLLLAREHGLDLEQAIETLSAGAGSSWAWNVLGGKIAAGDLKPAFMIRLMQKDLRIAQAAAQRLGVPMPGAALAQQLFRAVEATPGGDELGTQAMVLAFERMRGAKIDAGAPGAQGASRPQA
jgi:3-hydroxyisobutyrate dehydrogenase